MNEQERNLKLLRKLIDGIKSDIGRNREYFLNDTREIDFGKFYNGKIGEINMALLEFGKVLEILIDGLTSEIHRINFENKNLRK